ncbi:hypothetical protein KKF55_06135 [Patescibacteria group bacterium]|nr:hypothetical protein [Patescibacteria group bacterium]
MIIIRNKNFINRKPDAGENKVRSDRFYQALLRFCYNGKECAAAAGANFSAAAPVRVKIGSDLREGAPPSAKSARFRQYAPSYFGFPLHRVPFRTPAAGFSDTLFT